MAQPSLTKGLLAAVFILVIWSGFIVFARAGVLSGLTPYDVAALRRIVAGVLTLPFAIAWWPRNLPLKVQALLALAGPGAIYSMMMFAGLANASAAYGGVFANGALPIFTTNGPVPVTGWRTRGPVMWASSFGNHRDARRPPPHRGLRHHPLPRRPVAA